MRDLKKIVSIIVGCILVFFVTLEVFVNANQSSLYQNFRKIELFKSNRSDVEKLFKYTEMKETNKSNGSKTVYYKNKEARLTIDYSVGLCSERNSDEGYNVEKDIVIQSYIYFFNDLKISELNIKLDDFEIERSLETQTLTYTNEDLGIEISGSDKEIMSIEIAPSKSQEMKFRCDKKL